MKKYQNIHLSDKSLFTEYREKFNTNITQAHDVLMDTDLQTKIFRAQEYNDVLNELSSVETYYNDNVPQKLQDLLDELDQNILNLEYVGEYSSSTSYSLNDVVSYNNSLYYCKVASKQTITNIAPTNTTYWVYLGLRGQKGAFGSNIILKDGWDSTISYNAKDMVSYQDNVYVAVQNSTNQIPKNNTTFWQPLLSYDKRYIHLITNNSELSSLLDGDVFWKVV